MAPDMATPSYSRAGVFDFFGLPRELRDVIYDQETLTGTHCVAIDDAIDGVVELVTTVSLTNLLLVSRSFSDEYADRRQHLQIARLDDLTGSLGEEKIDIPKRVQAARHLDLRLVIHCDRSDRENHDCDVESEVEMHQGWLPSFIGQFHDLRGITIKLYISRTEECKACYERLRGHINTFAAMEKVELVEIVVSEARGLLTHPSEPSIRLAVWRIGQDALSEDLGFFEKLLTTVENIEAAHEEEEGEEDAENAEEDEDEDEQ